MTSDGLPTRLVLGALAWHVTLYAVLPAALGVVLFGLARGEGPVWSAVIFVAGAGALQSIWTIAKQIRRTRSSGPKAFSGRPIQYVHMTTAPEDSLGAVWSAMARLPGLKMRSRTDDGNGLRAETKRSGAPVRTLIRADIVDRASVSTTLRLSAEPTHPRRRFRGPAIDGGAGIQNLSTLLHVLGTEWDPDSSPERPSRLPISAQPEVVGAIPEKPAFGLDSPATQASARRLPG